MHSFEHKASVDVDGLLKDIERIVRIESPTPDRAGVNAVLDDVVQQFDGAGCAISRMRTGSEYGDILRVATQPNDTRPGILILSHVDTVHPIGTLAGPLPFRREDNKVYGPGIYDMKAGFMIAIAALRRVIANGSQALRSLFCSPLMKKSAARHRARRSRTRRARTATFW